MGTWDEVQCEEAYDEDLMGFREDGMNGESEDLMDRCEVVSLDALRNGGSYRIEDAVLEAEEMDDFWDVHEWHEDLMDNRCRLRRVGCSYGTV